MPGPLLGRPDALVDGSGCMLVSNPLVLRVPVKGVVEVRPRARPAAVDGSTEPPADRRGDGRDETGGVVSRPVVDVAPCALDGPDVMGGRRASPPGYDGPLRCSLSGILMVPALGNGAVAAEGAGAIGTSLDIGFGTIVRGTFATRSDSMAADPETSSALRFLLPLLPASLGALVGVLDVPVNPEIALPKRVLNVDPSMLIRCAIWSVCWAGVKAVLGAASFFFSLASTLRRFFIISSLPAAEAEAVVPSSDTVSKDNADCIVGLSALLI